MGKNTMRFTEAELTQMQQRVRGMKVTAAGGGIEAAIAKKIQAENLQTDLQRKKTPADWVTNKPKKKTSKPKLVDDLSDPDWTAPRTEKVKAPSKRKSINEHIAIVNQSIREAKVVASVSDRHLSIVWEGARLLTLNEILSLLPIQPYLVYNYKKVWENKVNESLLVAQDIRPIPYFDSSCVFIGLRCSTRLMDRDGLSSCFKYLLDDIRRQQAINHPILKDDNPNLIVDTPCFQYKGAHAVGFRLEKIDSWNEPIVDSTNLLSEHPLIPHLWGGR
jgi:hypothetical protein